MESSKSNKGQALREHHYKIEYVVTETIYLKARIDGPSKRKRKRKNKKELMVNT